MKRNTGSIVTLLLVIIAALSFSTDSFGADAKSGLSSSDCAKCHASQPADIEANGARHKTKITCQDCHTGHRPTSPNNIPKCNQCHQGKPHFELKDCLKCHTNPHTPLKVTFPGPLTEPCLTCHTAQYKQLQENKSKHSPQNCTNCHGVHRVKPACTQCHKPHSADITAADCTKCHKAHMPKVVTYASDINSKYCAACHQKQYNMLTASQVKHSTFACAFCHQDKHKMVPKCQDCHGNKHPAGIMAKFTKCGDCHNIAHDLNNWKNATEPAAAPAAPAKKKKN
jgi:predicted CXXCH cytochrome family protein